MEILRNKKHFETIGKRRPTIKQQRKARKEQNDKYPFIKISKKDALNLIKIHNNRLKAFTNSIAEFCDFKNMPRNETVPIPKEDMIQAFFKVEAEEAWLHIDPTPKAVITTLKSFNNMNSRYQDNDSIQITELDDIDDDNCGDEDMEVMDTNDTLNLMMGEVEPTEVSDKIEEDSED